MNDLAVDAQGPEFGGVVSRVLAYLLDTLILLPLASLSVLARAKGGLTVAVVAGLLVSASIIAYHVGFVALKGATPGKKMLRLLVARQDGGTVGWREAMLRSSVDFAFSAAGWIVVALAVGGIDPARYAAVGYATAVSEASGGWHVVVSVASYVWLFASALVLLLNARRRAIHDFIAGTVVVRQGRPA